MKTIDGHTIETGRIYYLVSPESVDISKCKCTEILIDPPYREIHYVTTVKNPKETDGLYPDQIKRLFKSLAKAKQFCLKTIYEEMDQFEECFDLQIKRIQRT